MAPQAGVSLFVADDKASCQGLHGLQNWGKYGAVASVPPRATAGFRDPTRPFRSANGTWWMVFGAGQKGKVAEALLFRATTSALTSFELAGVLLAANKTAAIATAGTTNGFFDMTECPDVFPLGGGLYVRIASAYLSSQPPYPKNGFHSPVTWWLGRGGTPHPHPHPL